MRVIKNKGPFKTPCVRYRPSRPPSLERGGTCLQNRTLLPNQTKPNYIPRRHKRHKCPGGCQVGRPPLVYTSVRDGRLPPPPRVVG